MSTFSTSRHSPKLAFARWSVLALVAAWLSGCALAPGLFMGDGVVGSSSQASRYSASTQPTTGLPVVGAGVDAPPPGALRSITPELIRQQRAAQATDVGQDVKRLFGVAKPYLIGSGDVLNIVVWDHPELNIVPAGGLATDAGSLSGVGNGYNVSPNGLVQFPYVGNLKVGGLNEYEVRDQLTTRLAKFFKDPQVTVRIQAYRAGRVYVDGEVRTPGLQAVNDVPMTLPEAIGRAGGFTVLADRSTVAISRNGTTTPINLQQLTAMGINPSSILLAGGDLVRVLSRDESKVYVMGEVTRPLAQPLRNGRLTLNEALGEAGGVNPLSGDPRQIYVVRSQPDGLPEIYHLDVRAPAAYALAEGFELQSRDVVYVDPAPLVRWNRVISLILPSASVVNVTRDVTRP
ncbi:MAG: polysaccharide biosynthesis/export family protein [Polaromonas sp.]|nr:polysaccharide biosynthesis/export family protein [Polaromonas sp.]